MKILVVCELPAAAIDELSSLGLEVVYEPGSAGDALRQRIGGVGIIVVGGGRISAETVARGTALQMIIRAGDGPGNVAVEEASQQGIFVTHCPDKRAAAIAELTIGLILALDRDIVDNTQALREGRWQRGKYAAARGLAGRALGVLGLDAVARLVARRARAFEMRVLAWPPAPASDAMRDIELEFCNRKHELAERSDVVTVHEVDDPDGPTIVDAEFLDCMSEGAYLVHVGRPDAVDEAALADAVRRRHLRVALDVHQSEPLADTGRFRCNLLDLPGVIATQHIGPLTQQARSAVADEVVRIARTFLISGEVLNCLNLAERSPARWQLVLRVRDQVGVMASILDSVRADGINAEEISSRVFTGAKAAWCTIALNERPSAEAIEAIRSIPDVMHLEVRAVV